MRSAQILTILTVLATPLTAQDGPLIIDIPNANDADHAPLFGPTVAEQLNAPRPAGQARVIDLADGPTTPMQREMAADPMLAPATLPQQAPDSALTTMAPLAQLRQAGATRIEMLDRCAAFESSLVTILAANELRPQLANRHREQFSHFTTAVIAERRAAGLSDADAQQQSGNSILEVARLYMTEWENAQQRTGSYFGTPLRRLDTLACAALLEGADPVDRPSLSEQLGQDKP